MQTSQVRNVETSDALGDVIVHIVHRKKTILVWIIVFMLLAGGSIIIFPPKYRYYQTLSIGQLIAKTDRSIEMIPLESPQTVAAKLNNGYIGSIITRRSKADRLIQSFDIKAIHPSESLTIILSGIGRKRDAEKIKSVIEQASRRVIDDHNRLAITLRSAFSGKITQIIPTQLVEAAVQRSVKPVGIPGVKRILISAVVGLLIGIFWVVITAALEEEQKLSRE